MNRPHGEDDGIDDRPSCLERVADRQGTRRNISPAPSFQIDPPVLAGLIPAIGRKCFFDDLRKFVSVHVPIDNCVVVVFCELGQPLVLHQWSPQSPNFFQMHYAREAYQLDPFYLASLDERRDGIHRLGDIAPDDFKQSDFFENYFNKVRMIDEIGLLIPYDRHLTLHLSLGRRADSEVFSDQDLTDMQFLGPILSAILLRHCGPLIDRALQVRGTARSAANTFATLLADRWSAPFGVTMREAETAALILRGHSNSSIGLALDISPETVKVHRRNLYAKLRISSPTELFMLFLNQSMPLDLPSGALG